MPAYTKTELQKAVLVSKNLKEVLEELGLRAAGGNYQYLKKWLEEWTISTSHFETAADRAARARRFVTSIKKAQPLEEILVENSTYNRGHLKKRLYKEGLKKPICELCGQDEHWQGKKMALILDHINGVYNDNRLKNLQIVCPNCNATLETFCGRDKRKKKKVHQPHYSGKGIPVPKRRKAMRPPYKRLKKEVGAIGYRAVGRKYGVSDNAVRKWVKFYEENPSLQK